MSKIWDIVQRHLDDYGPSEAEVARRIGAKPQTLSSWKKRGVHRLPQARLLLGLAQVTMTPYEDVLRAALHDTRYLPKEVVEHDARSAPRTQAGDVPAFRDAKANGFGASSDEIVEAPTRSHEDDGQE